MQDITSFWPALTLGVFAASLWFAVRVRREGVPALRRALAEHGAESKAYAGARRDERQAQAALQQAAKTTIAAHKSVRRLFWQVEPQWVQ